MNCTQVSLLHSQVFIFQLHPWSGRTDKRVNWRRCSGRSFCAKERFPRRRTLSCVRTQYFFNASAMSSWEESATGWKYMYLHLLVKMLIQFGGTHGCYPFWGSPQVPCIPIRFGAISTFCSVTTSTASQISPYFLPCSHTHCVLLYCIKISTNLWFNPFMGLLVIMNRLKLSFYHIFTLKTGFWNHFGSL